MDAGALELHLRRLSGVVACQLTATEAVLLLDGGDPAAVRIAAQAALDQAGSNRTIHLLAVTPPAAPVPLWRRRRFAVLAGAAGALSAGIAAASTLASMPGVVQPADEVAVGAPEEVAPADRWAVRTQVPAPARAAATAAAAVEVTEVPEPADDGVALVSTGTDAAAAAGAIALAPVSAPPPLEVAPAAPVARSEPLAPAPQPEPAPGVVAAGADDEDDRPGRGRARESRSEHPHGAPPGHLMRAGRGPW